MDIRNSSGALVSLLNDSSVEAGSGPARLPSLALHSRTSSFASTPIISSPPTPQLVRSDSSDSATMQRTPSPVTPVSFGFDGVPVASKSQDASFPHHPSFFPPAKESSSMYPLIPQQTNPSFAYPAPGAPIAPQGPMQTSSGESRPQSSTKVSGKKNQYPCPLAKQYNCSDYFTTSGHAARHAKKHTGKKDAFCPECNKAFTRKDNMEQHRRTHQNGRNSSSKGASDGESAPNKRAKTSHSSSKTPRSKPAPIQQAPTAQMVEQSPISPASSFGFADSHSNLPLQAVPPASLSQYPPELLQESPYAQSSPYPVAMPYYDPANMSGLDKLAMAATGESPRQALESPPQPPNY